MRAYAHVRQGWEWEARATATRRAERPRFGQMVWKYGWGLIFVCVMTVLSEYVPDLGVGKFVDEAAPVTSQPLTHVVK